MFPVKCIDIPNILMKIPYHNLLKESLYSHISPQEVVDMKVFKVTGTFKMGTKWMPFTKEFLVDTKAEAKERIYSDLGSKHRTERRYIKIETIDNIPPEEATDQIIKEILG